MSRRVLVKRWASDHIRIVRLAFASRVVRIVIFTYASIALVQFSLDQFDDPKWQHRVRLNGLLPHLSPQVWIIVGFGLLTVFGFEFFIRDILRLETALRVARGEPEEPPPDYSFGQLGFLEVMREGAKALEKLPGRIQEIGVLATKSTKEMSAFTENLPADVDSRIKAANRIAGSVTKFANKLESRANAIRKPGNYAVGPWKETARREDISNQKGRAALTEFKKTCHIVMGQMGAAEAKQLRVNMETLVKANITQRLTAACQRGANAADEWVAFLTAMQGGLREAEAIAKARLTS